MAFIRSISGLRATLDDLTPSRVKDYVSAFATILPAGPIVVGRDGRPSGTAIAAIVEETLLACGRDVHTAGIVPTPTVQLLVERSNAAGGIVITASHNPAEWNGLKFLDSGGVFIDADVNARLWDVVDRSTQVFVGGDGLVKVIDNAIDMHLNVVAEVSLVARAPRANGERVVVDAVNASGSIIVPRLLRSYGYDVVELYCDGSGNFPHLPEPVPSNLGSLAAAVVEHQAVMGVAVDPDADRLVLIDDQGTPIGEELTITLAVQSVLASGMKGDVVVNYSTTRTVDDVAAHYGVSVFRAPVGEINVVKLMDRVRAIVGGEGSGGVILPSCHRGRDSIVGIALITSLLRTRGQRLSEAVDALPQYHMVKTKLDVADVDVSIQDFIDACASEFSNALISTGDGLHAAWPDKWIHVRASNTEPIFRVIAEALDAADAEALISRASSVLHNLGRSQ
jgi:phosphomannomutase